MFKRALFIAVLPAVLFVSCKKDDQQPTPLTAAKTTSSIAVPAGFSWQNSRNINITVNVIDRLYPGDMHVVSIYDGDPAAGGNLLSKGVAISTISFKTKVYLSNRITNLYIAGIFPNGLKFLEKVQVGTTDINTSLGS